MLTLIITIPFTFAQVKETGLSTELRNQQLAGLSSWFESLDAFLSESRAGDGPEAVHKAWEQFNPASRLPVPAHKSVSESVADPELAVGELAGQALNELAMLATGMPSTGNSTIRISHLPLFITIFKTRPDPDQADVPGRIAEMHAGANPLRVILAFLSALNPKDREAFRLLSGIELESVFSLLDFSADQVSAQGSTGIDQPDARFPESSLVELLESERLLGSWRSSRLHPAGLQPGKPGASKTNPETGKYLAALLDTAHGPVIFNPGWAGERFAEDARRDLNEAWLAIGRAVAIDLRREAAPWLARRLGKAAAPSFSLEYSVQPSPSNAYKALMTMRAVTAGTSYGIPYQVVARALGAASAVYFGDAPAPVRYIEEPLPGLRIYIPRDEADRGKAITELEADLSAAYPSALNVPSVLLAIPSLVRLTHAESCLALDGAYREVAAGALLARMFTNVLHSRGYPELAAMVVHEADAGLPETAVGVEGRTD